MDLLSVSGLTKFKSDTAVVNDIHFTQQAGQKIGIAGATGSGKSTLLRMIAGLEQPDSGTVWYKGKKVLGPEEKLIAGHKGIGYVSQHFELRNNYKVAEELAYTNELTEEEANKIYQLCRIDHLLQRKTHELSGGERQRIVTARVLIARPELLLLDEPFSNLDVFHTQLMKEVIDDITAAFHLSCILVSHDPKDTLSWADELFILQNGRLTGRGSPQQLYYYPADEYTAALLGKCNLIDKREGLSLLPLPGIDLKGKSVMIRPEQWIIATDARDAVSGQVTSISFMGNSREAKVLLTATLTVTITVPYHTHLSVGDKVWLTLNGVPLCYLD